MKVQARKAPFARARVTMLGCVVGACVFAIMTQSAAAGDDTESLPSSEMVVTKLIEGAGGEAAIKAVSKQHVVEVIKLPMQGMEFRATTYADAGNVMSRAEIAGIGEFRGGKNGSVVWSMDPMTGPRILTGAEREQFERTATHNPVGYVREYKSHECVAIEELDGRRCYKLILTPNTGKPETWWADAETWRLVQMNQTIESPMGALTSVTKFSDYRQIAGCWIAHMGTSDMTVQKTETRIEKFETEFELPDGIFDLPPEIIALAKKQVGGGDEKKAPPTTMPKSPEGEKVGG